MLTEILQAQPDDAFARYGLAMAYAETSRNEDALAEFARLRTGSPDYVPGYQMAGQLLVRLGRDGEAREVLDAGIAAAHRTGKSHALAEMQALIDDL